MSPNLGEIIAKSNTPPTIVNADSQFVVVTYWWGRGNINNNTSRPCAYFWETMFDKFIRIFTMKYFHTVSNENRTRQRTRDRIRVMDVDRLLGTLKQTLSRLSIFNTEFERKAQSYLDLIYESLHLLHIKDKVERHQMAETAYQTRFGHPLPTKAEIVRDFKEIVLDVIHENRALIYQLFLMQKDLKALEGTYKHEKEHDLEMMKQRTQEIVTSRSTILDTIKQYTRQKRPVLTFFGQSYANSNIYDVLNTRFRYQEPILFEEMIQNWEETCARAGCNYLAIEYKEFAAPGGYQLGINAKPRFIQRALELCAPRSVLYIDGDMTVNKYPYIFDMKGVDFMARNWHVDPRSSDRVDTSIYVDPYKFETSGGIMYFAPTHESRRLIDAWVSESDNPRQRGKADDRILSLIFQTKGFLLSLNVIQLPIEYLWLSMDYDERALDKLDMTRTSMREAIYIEHPECLTSEDTAAGAGASSDRTPHFYNFLSLDEDSQPVSESLYQYLMFPDEKMAKAFHNYHSYLMDAVYLQDEDDPNPILDDLQLVGEQPFYVTKYATKYGGTRNPIVARNEKRIRDELNETYLTRHADKFMTPNLFGYVVVREEDVAPLGEEYTIPLILALLQRGHSVMYRPTATQPDHEMDIMIRDSTRLELVFYPDTNPTQSFFKPFVQLNKPMLFRITEQVADPRTSMLYKSLIMFESLADMSDVLASGSFQIISRVRVGYMYVPKKSTSATLSNPKYSRGGSKTRNVDPQSYEQGLQWLYGNPPAKTVQLIKKLQHRIYTRTIRRTKTARRSRSKAARNTRSMIRPNHV
jgi:hypothetical protein